MAEEGPLSPDNTFLLDVNQDELVKRMNFDDSILLSLLKDREIITFAEAEAIQVLSGRKAQGEKLISILKDKSDEEFHGFCEVLRETGHKHLVSFYLSQSAIDKKIKHLQDRLATYFRNTYVEEMFAYHDEGHRVRLEEVYQPLQWVEHETSASGTATRPLDSYQDLFTQGTYEGNFVVTAEANGGKTTMLRKICRDWADQHLGGAARVDALSRFVVVIPIILRAVKQGASLIDTVKQQLGLTKKEMKILIYCLETKRQGIFFIYDGLDEYNIDKSQEVTDIMSGELYPSSWCIITSRPEGASCLQDWPEVIYREAQLKGFSADSIRKYVQRFFHNKDAALGDRLLQAIFPVQPPDTKFLSQWIGDTHTGLVELASNPGRLALICIIYSENETLPSTKEQLTEEFVRFMLRRWQRKFESGQASRQSRLGILDEYKHVVLAFSKLAAKIDGGKMKLVFTHEELINHVDSHLMKIGLIYKSHPVSRLEDCEYSFIHKSIQEYMTAYHMYHSQGDGAAAVRAVMQELMNLHEDVHNTDNDRMKYLVAVMQVWVLCGYVSLQHVSVLLTETFNKPEYWKRACQTLDTLQSALRHAPLVQMALPEPVTVERGRERITFQLPVYSVYQEDEDNQQLAPPAVHILHQDDQPLCELTWPVHLQALLVVDVETRQDDTCKIDAFMTCNQTAALMYAHQLPLVLKGPTVEHLELLTAGRTDVTNLNKDIQSVEVYRSQLSGKGAWLAHSLACLDPRQISIQSSGLQQQDVQDMTSYLQQHHSSLAADTLYFNTNDLSGAGEDIVKLLQHMPRLTSLDLENSHLSDGDKQMIITYLGGRMEDVEVNMNDKAD